jgi:hypothetical protein
MLPCRRDLLTFPLCLGLAACASPGIGDRDDIDESPLSAAGAVFLFPGFTLPGDTYVTTGTYRMTREIRSRGVRAEINYPGEWEATAERLVRNNPDAAGMPIAIVGYSFGARAAVDMARGLAEKGIPVQTVVVIEATASRPVPANVARALHLYLSDGLFSWASRIEPSADFHGSLENLPLSERLPDGALLDHWSVSRVDAVHAMVIEEILEGRRVRRRWPSLTRR